MFVSSRQVSAASIAKLIMSDAALSGNTASGSGGGLYVAGAVNVTGSGSTVVALNIAGANGGGYNSNGQYDFRQESAVGKLGVEKAKGLIEMKVYEDQPHIRL